MNLSPILIRPAVLGDIGSVRALLVETWHDTYDSLLGPDRVTETTNEWHAVEVLSRQATSPNISFLIATCGVELVGQAYAIDGGNFSMHLSRLYISPARQREGIGQQLLQAVITRHVDAKFVHLIVEARNTKGLAFYCRNGFTVTGELEEEDPPPLRMEKIIVVEPSFFGSERG